MKNKTLVIGFDGGTFKIIKPLIEKGKLPTFKRLMEEGSWGVLDSTIPPVSSPAWPSFFTGRKPGNHGVYDWFKYKKDYSEYYNNSTDVKGKRYWDYLNEKGLVCGVMNVPITYPPQKIDGFMIAGFLASEEKNFVYPKSLKKEILDEGYTIEHKDQRSISDKKHITGMREILETRKRVLLKLMKEKKWDILTFVILQEPMQHRFWKKGTMEHIYEMYERVDKTIGEILDEAKKQGNTNIFILSDHGFGRVPDKAMYFNMWLVEKGYLTLKSLESSKVMIEKVYNVLKKMGLSNLRHLLRQKMGSVRRINKKSVNWSKTKCWARLSEDTGLIYLNKKTRFEKGILNEEEALKVRNRLIKELRGLTDPETKEKLIGKIWEKEELYRNNDINAPDLVFKIKDTYKVNDIIGKEVFKPIPEDSRVGWHSPDGIFIAAGPNIKKKKLKTANIIDVAPTILSLYDIKAKEMDGKALSIIKNKIPLCKRTKKVERFNEQKEVFDKKDKDRLKEKLRALGYI